MADVSTFARVSPRGAPAPRVGSTLAKRGVDLVTAAIGLVVLLPVAAILALAVLVTMGRPILFVQERPGLAGRAFPLVKFRTMVPARPGVGTADDPARITRLGRFLRRTSLDELPELLNVLRGDMSLVGPRPLLSEYLPRYTARQARRHEVRPGITGLAQVTGRKVLSWDETFDLDVWYVDHRTLWLDLTIIARTFRAVIRTRSTESADLGRPDFTGTVEGPPTVQRPQRGPAEDDEQGRSVLPVLTVDELGEWKERRGLRVVSHGGTLWERHRAGFFQPVHLHARIAARDATRPSPTAWGYRAALSPDDHEHATGSIPLRMMSDVGSFDPSTWSGNRRNQLRRSQKRSEIAPLTDLTVLERHGWEIVASSAERIGFQPPTPAAYRTELESYADLDRLLVLGSTSSGAPTGYLTGFACGDTAYVDRVFVRSDALNTYASIGLLHAFLRICQDTPGIDAVVHGLERRENPSLGRFKDGFGFPVVEVPAKVVLPGLVERVIRHRRPDSLHRLTGRG